jgi:hypothetical protein
VAKRVRGSHSTHRPGGQGPSRNKKTGEEMSSDAGTTAPVADIDGALQTVESSYTEIAIDESAPAPRTSRRARRSTKAKSDSLDGRVAAENVYVREDLRRIGVVSVVLVVMLAVAWVLFYAMDLLGLY